MSDGEGEPARAKKAFETAVESRKLEIELFWQRSLFFWGFIAAIFIAFAELRDDSPRLGAALAGLGVVCSMSWTLANRGSKYWQEAWEQKVEREESVVTGPLFVREEEILDKGPWLKARRYSVTKLAIALSDFITLFWLLVAIGQVVVSVNLRLPWVHVADVALLAYLAGAVVFAVGLLWWGRSTLPRRKA